jgi:hypothetical protein
MPEGSAGIKRAGWWFYVPVCAGIAGGAFLILGVELLSTFGLIGRTLRDAGLVFGGALVGLVALWLYEIYLVAPERRRIARQREAELQRHQEERRLDFEQYRTLQAELRETRARASALEGKLNLGGALDRDRVGDALLLGFYFHRRSERLPSPPKQSIFKTAAQRLKLLRGKTTELKLDKAALHDVLEIAYGPVVAESFDLGYVLSHLGQEGFKEGHPEMLAELEEQLKLLRLDGKSGVAAQLPEEITGLFRRLAARVMTIVRGR